MSKKREIIDLRRMNLSFEDRGHLIKLVNFKPRTMTLEIERYVNGNLDKKDTIVFAHLPKKLKAELNPLF